jgi:predicted GNAT superfamily acetyltransferase
MTTSTPQYEIRHCHAVEEFRECVQLQKQVWNFDDRDLIPVRMFVVARKVEGQVIAAFTPAGAMMGFCLAIPGLHGAQTYLHSHMLAVLPEYRRTGVGQRLKWEQRREALARGIELIEWTFDPLEWMNASLNLNRLGAIARRCLPNIYGISSSPLHRGLPTDRLVAEWWLRSPRVVAAAEGGMLDAPSAGTIEFALGHLIDGLGGSPPTATVQGALRAQLQQAFAAGLLVSGFREDDSGRGKYLLAKPEDAGL